MTQIDTNYRGPRIDSTDAFRVLAVNGVRTVLNLERGYFEFFTGQVDLEVERVLSLRMIRVSMALGDIVKRTKDQLEGCIWVMTDKCTFGIVYVHCKRGKDRTGMVCAYYRVKIEHWPVDKAIQEMFDNGFNRALYEPLGW